MNGESLTYGDTISFDFVLIRVFVFLRYETRFLYCSGFVSSGGSICSTNGPQPGLFGSEFADRYIDPSSGTHQLKEEIYLGLVEGQREF